MRNMFWHFVKDTADTGTWGRSHAALLALVPAVALLGWLVPDPPLYIFIPVCTVLGGMVKHAVFFPVSTLLMDRRQLRHHAG